MIPRVAVIVPVYNGARWLEDCLLSVQAQGYPDWGCWIMDDASTDETPKIANRWAQKEKFVHHRNLVRGGCAKARNIGYQASESEFLLFLDGDDILTGDALTRLVKRIDGTDFPAVYGYCGRIDANGAPLDHGWPSYTDPFDEHIAFYDLWWENRISTPGQVLLKRATLDEQGVFTEEFEGAADWDLWLRIASKHAIGRVPEITLWYRQHAESMTQSRQQEMEAWCEAVRRERIPEYDRQHHAIFDPLRAAREQQARQGAAPHLAVQVEPAPAARSQ